MKVNVLTTLMLVMYCTCFGEPTTPTSTTKATKQTTGVITEMADRPTTLTPGIPAFAERHVQYQMQSGQKFDIQFGEPVVIAVATKPEKWGFFQFPNIGKNTSGTIWAKWNLTQDSITAYGTSHYGLKVSDDGGNTWTEPADGFTTNGGVLMSNGDRINVTTPKALPESELKLPDPVGLGHDTYAKQPMKLFRHDELPAIRQGAFLERLPAGGTEWQAEQATLDDPMALRYSFKGLVPVVWWGDMHMLEDGSAVTGIYPGFHEKDDGSYSKQYGVFFYRSTDNGKSWKIQGRIPYEPDLGADPHGAERMGFSEPAFEVLKDGTFLCVMRTDDGRGRGPMYSSVSLDQGKTWSEPKAFSYNGVLPRLLQLENGVVALASGRPGMQLRFSTDMKGEHWTEPFEMLPSKGGNGDASCGYPGLLETGPDRFLVIYSDFKFKNEAGEIRKAIKVREIVVKAAEAE